MHSQGGYERSSAFRYSKNWQSLLPQLSACSFSTALCKPGMPQCCCWQVRRGWAESSLPNAQLGREGSCWAALGPPHPIHTDWALLCPGGAAGRFSSSQSPSLCASSLNVPGPEAPGTEQSAEPPSAGWDGGSPGQEYQRCDAPQLSPGTVSDQNHAQELQSQWDLMAKEPSQPSSCSVTLLSPGSPGCSRVCQDRQPQQGAGLANTAASAQGSCSWQKHWGSLLSQGITGKALRAHPAQAATSTTEPQPQVPFLNTSRPGTPPPPWAA